MQDEHTQATGPPAADPADATLINADAAATKQEAEAPQEIKCPSCSTVNPPTEEFCGHCGTALSNSADSPLDPTTNEDPRTMTEAEREEFKLLTLPKTPIAVSSHGSTHIGRVVEYDKDEVNEDAVHVPETIYYPAHKIAVHVAIVADGMGGEPGGEVFSQMACFETWLGIRFLLPYFEQQHGFTKLEFWRFINGQLASYLPAQVASANTRIVRYAKMKQFKTGGCGSTIVVVVAVCDLETGRVTIHGFNEGDARCALVVGEQFHLLSTDHTIDGAPYRFLGRRDQIGGSPFSQDIWLAESEAKSFWVLLYSDGLWNMLSPAQMTAATTASPNPESLCNVLVASALSVLEPAGKEQDARVQPGDDNITIAAIRCDTVEGV